MNKASLNFQKCFYLFFRFQALLFMEIQEEIVQYKCSYILLAKASTTTCNVLNVHNIIVLCTTSHGHDRYYT